jgi:hypothetical protein
VGAYEWVTDDIVVAGRVVRLDIRLRQRLLRDPQVEITATELLRLDETEAVANAST